MRLHNITLAVALSSLGAITACDSGTSSRVTEAEKTIQTQAVRIEALENRVNELDDKVLLLDFSKDQFRSVTLDPSDQGFGRLDSSVGTFAVSIQQVSAHADGVRVRLHVGNLTTAAVNGGTFKAKWGSRSPKTGEKGWAKSFAAWQKSLVEKDISFTDELRPGTWNNVSLVLPGLPPEKFGYLELQMETNQIKLLVPRR